MDKKVFLLDKENEFYTKELVEKLTENQLEEWVLEESYEDNFTIIKIDANDYSTPMEAINEELPFCDVNDYYVVSFGF